MAKAQRWRVERSINIGAPAQKVFDELIDFRGWQRWSPWEDLDPNLQRTYTGASRGVGAGYAWKGNRKAGQGSMRITEVRAPLAVDISLSFLKPFRSDNTVRFTLAPSEDATRLTWAMSGPATMMTKVMGLFTSMDKLVGRDFEKGLARLKGRLEE